MDADALAQRECKPCSQAQPPLKGQDLRALAEPLKDGWQVVDEHHLEKAFRFKDFREALDFTNRVGQLAEQQGHHPDLALSWGRVKVTLFTHKIGGLSENDFILAAKIDRL